jgi:hypothetical protein
VEAALRAHLAASGRLSGKNHPSLPKKNLDRGAEVGQILTHTFEDDAKIIADLLHNLVGGYFGLNQKSCTNTTTIGICIKCEGFYCKTKPYYRFRVPVAKVEIVDQPFKSGYSYKHNSKFKIALYETLLGSMLEQLAEQSLQRAARLAGKGGVTSGYSATKAYKAAKQHFSKDLRFRNVNPNQGGYVYTEFHVYPEPLNYLWHTYFEGRYDTKLGYIPWQSEGLGTFDSRFSVLSYSTFPAEMGAVDADPLACLSDPAIIGVLGGNPAKWKMHNKLTGLCQAKAQGAWVPLTNTMVDDHFASAAYVAFRRAVKTAFMRLPPMFYNYDDETITDVETRVMTPERKDRVMGLRGRGIKYFCHSIGGREWEELGSQGNASAKLEETDPWIVYEQWRQVRGCPPGYMPIGPLPQWKT